MEFSEQVLILHVGKFKESDMWLRILSPTRGLFSIFAFGGSRSRQRFVGCLDIFNTVLFRIKLSTRSGYFSAEEGVLIKGPGVLRKDWNKLGIAQNCSNFLQAFGVESDGADKAYDLFKTTLDYLEGEETINALFPLFFRLRFVSEQGYRIDATRCHHCGTTDLENGAKLFVKDGLLLCPSCSQRGSGVSVHLGRGSIEALNIVQHQPPGLWKRFDNSLRQYTEFPAEVLRECGRAIDKFVEYHVGLHWDGGRFKKV